MRLVLPLPPSANRYWRNVGGRVVKSAEARSYLGACQIAAAAQFKGEPMEGRLKLEADFYMDGRGDLDNRVKQLGDSLQGIVFLNDSQLWEIHLRRHREPKLPRVEITVTSLEAA